VEKISKKPTTPYGPSNLDAQEVVSSKKDMLSNTVEILVKEKI